MQSCTGHSVYRLVSACIAACCYSLVQFLGCRHRRRCGRLRAGQHVEDGGGFRIGLAVIPGLAVFRLEGEQDVAGGVVQHARLRHCIAMLVPSRNCSTTTQRRRVPNISTSGDHKGLITHGRYSQLVYSAMSVFETPSRLYMTTETDITKTYGSPSAK